MSNDKMRAEFEKWRDSLPGGTICATPAQAWQAATEVYTDLLQAKDMEIHELKFFIDGEAPLKAIIDAQAAEIARLTSDLAKAEFIGETIVSIVGERDAARVQLADQTDARNLAITEHIEITKYCDDLREQLGQALAAVDPMAEQNQTGAANLEKITAQAAAQTGVESPQTRMNARHMPPVSVGVERELVARDALTDAEIVEVLHSLGIDTYPSKYNFPEAQVSATNVPSIRRVVESCIARLDSRVTAVIDPQPSADDARDAARYRNIRDRNTDGMEDYYIENTAGTLDDFDRTKCTAEFDSYNDEEARCAK